MLRRFIAVFALVAMLLVPVSARADYVLPAHLRAQINELSAPRLDANGCATTSTRLYVAQIANGARGGPVTPEDTAWLLKLRTNIGYFLAGNPPAYPDVVYGAYCV